MTKRGLGPRAVEAYIPLNATGASQRIIGVLEIYLPYAPISTSFAASNRAMEIVIALGPDRVVDRVERYQLLGHPAPPPAAPRPTSTWHCTTS